jgi:hypothetical protein
MRKHHTPTNTRQKIHAHAQSKNQIYFFKYLIENNFSDNKNKNNFSMW